MQLKKCSEKKIISEYWEMRVVHESSKPNMMIQKFHEAIQLDDGNTILVKFPCALNTHKIPKDAELVLYRPAPPKENKTKAVTAEFSESNKKQRSH